jgi:hypothetical protein
MRGKAVTLGYGVKEMICKKAKFCLAAAVGALLPVSRMCLAETEPYAFYVSGFPAENRCSSKESAGIGITSGTLTRSSSDASLEFRFRTSDFSVGTSLRSDKYRLFSIVVR